MFCKKNRIKKIPLCYLDCRNIPAPKMHKRANINFIFPVVV